MCRYCGQRRLCAALGSACVDNLVSAIKQQRKKTGLSPTGKEIIADDKDAIVLDHLRLDHGGFAPDELRFISLSSRDKKGISKA